MRCLPVLALTSFLVASAPRAEEVSPTRLQLPDGPGSVLGLGAGFEPNPGTGTLGFELQIEVPPGAGGLAPRLGLRYDGGAGEGLLGPGWSIAGLPSIRVSTRGGVPLLDGTDALEVVGFGPPSDLVATTDGFYRPRFESGTFIRVQRSRDGRDWEIRDKAGLIYRFGGAATIEDDGRPAEWLLTEILDRHGHRIVCSWFIEEGVGRPARMAYNLFGAAVENTVEFEYTPRADPREGFESGLHRRDAHRLFRIRTTHGGRPVRALTADYHPGHRTRLASLVLTGGAGERLPALAFEYTAATIEPALRAVEGGPPLSPDQGDIAFVDLDGDALPDVLEAVAGHYRSYRNLDGHRFGAPLAWSGAASPSFSLVDPGSTLADLDGDGALDLLARTADGTLGTLPGGADGFFGRVLPVEGSPGLDVDAPDVRMADLNGDRRIDLIGSTPAGLLYSENDGGRRFARPALLPWPEGAEALRFDAPGIDLCEINGDGLPDLCHLRSTHLAYWLGRGRGRFEPQRTATGVPAFEAQARFTLRDVDGDGRDDLIRLGVGHVSLALAVTDGAFGEVVDFAGLPEAGHGRYMGLHDVDGSGTLEVVFVDRDAAPTESAWQVLELLPAGRPGLLTRIVDGRGVERRFEYVPAAAARMEPRPDRGPVDGARQNVAMTVLARTLTQTALAEPALVEQMTYHGGTWDAAERVFAGFQYALRRSEGADGPSTLVRRLSLSPGLLHPAMRGAVLEETLEDGEGRVFSETVDTWEIVAIDAGVDGTEVRYAYPAREDAATFEGSAAGRHARTERVHDAHGNVVREANWGDVEGDDALAGGDEAVTIRRFAEDIDEWVLGAVAFEEVQDAHGVRLRATRSFYDGPAHHGLPEGEVTRGDLSRREAWRAGEAWVRVESHAHDGDGHVVESRDGVDGRRTYIWDTADRTFLIEERVHLPERALVWQSRTDRATGAMIESVAPGGERRSRRVDAFGRPTVEWLAGDSEALPTRTYTYDDEGPLPRVIVQARRSSGDDEVDHQESLSDGLGRTRGLLVRHPDGRWVLSGATGFDERGHEIWRQNARVLPDPGAVLEAIGAPLAARRVTYDALGRPVDIVSAAGRHERYAYHPRQTEYWHGGQLDPGSADEHTPSVRAFDGRGRLVSITETLAGRPLTTRFRWDASGALTGKTDPLGRASTFEYDGLGRRTAVVDPDAGRFAFAFDEASRLQTKTQPDGQVTRYTWDAAGRSVAVDDDGDGVPEVRRIWDETRAGKLGRTEDAVGVLTLEYDDRGRPVCRTWALDGARHRTCEHFDAQDRHVGHQHADGSHTTWHVDALGRVDRIDGLAAIERDPEGRATAQRFETGLRVESSFDEDGLPTGQRVVDPGGGTVERMTWVWDAAARVVGRSRDAADHTSTERFAYDNLGRLRFTEGDLGETTWMFDDAGGLVSRASDTPSLNVGDVTYDPGHPSTPTRFGPAALEWDANRRLAYDGTRRYTWGANGLPSRIEHADGRAAENVFDADGVRRVQSLRSVGGSVHRSVYLGEFDEIRDGDVIRYVVLDGRRIARLDALPLPWAVEGEGSMQGLGLFGVFLGLLALFARRPGLAPVSLTLLAAFACTEVVERSTSGGGGDGRDAGPADMGSGNAGSDDARTPTDGTPAETDAGPGGGRREVGPARFLYDPAGSLLRVVDPAGATLAVRVSHPYGVAPTDGTDETMRFAGLMHDELGVEFTPARIYVPELEIWASLDPVAIDEPERQVEEAALLWPTYRYAANAPLHRTDTSGRAPSRLVDDPRQGLPVRTVGVGPSVMAGPVGLGLTGAYDSETREVAILFTVIGGPTVGKAFERVLSMPKVEGWKAYLRPQVTVSALFGPSELDGLTGPGFTTTVSAAAARVGTSASTSALWGVVGVGAPDFGVSTEASYTWKVGSIHLPDVAARLFGGLDWQPAPSTVARSAGSGASP